VSEDGTGEERPVLRVITPDATAEEIAALVAVFSSLGSAAPARPGRSRSEWAAPHRAVRVRYSHGQDGWRSSGMPR
jgi:hypothetical protein